MAIFDNHLLCYVHKHCSLQKITVKYIRKVIILLSALVFELEKANLHLLFLETIQHADKLKVATRYHQTFFFLPWQHTNIYLITLHELLKTRISVAFLLSKSELIRVD